MAVQILQRLRRLLSHASALTGNRLELFGLELQEEVERAIGHLACLFAVLLLAGLCLMSLSAGLLILAHSFGMLLETAFLLAAVYGCLCSAVGIFLIRRFRQAPRAFALSRAEFLRDEKMLRPTEQAIEEGEA